MISTKNIVCNLSDIREEWIFETYLKLERKLIGQEEVITSVFNTSERSPSLTIFFDATKHRYYWKDFSSSRGGTAYELVCQLHPEMTKGEVTTMLLNTYKAYLKGNPVDANRKYRQFGKYRVDSWIMRNWTSIDQKFWTPGGISSKLLEKYNVAPLQSFSMTKVEQGVSKTINITRDRIYAYFRNDGQIARIYQPRTDAKYLKVLPYIQGSNQLTYTVDNLIILSGMKDSLAFMGLGIENYEFICPDSENTILSKIDMEKYFPKYKKVSVLFDEDAPGIAAMRQYEDKYKTKSIFTKFEVKDLFDAIAKFGQEKVRIELIKLLK